MASEEPTYKDKKYDRQIRLWGSGGQKALETAHVCLLNASGLGTETLKNLVLPGIGSFTIIDGQRVTEGDLGNNFFLTADNMGESRGEWAAKWLLELNPDVKGGSLNKDPEEVIQTNPAYFRESAFTLVIATQLPESLALKLASTLEKEGIPLLLVRSCGLFGFLRIQSPSYAIMEAFPDQQAEDYHVLDPFPELLQFTQVLGDPDFIEDSLLHSHIPWVCLMIHYIQKWKAQTGWSGKSLTYAQRKEILALVSGGQKKEDEENFHEACRAGSKINPPDLPSHLAALMGSKEADLESGTSEPFWLCMHALRQFYAQHARLPLNGKLADLTSTTQWFIQLQQVYAAKAQQDVVAMTALAQGVAGAGQSSVSPDYVAQFCKNVWHVRYYKTRPLELELSPASANVSTLAKACEPEASDIVWYLLLRATDQFVAENNRCPGDGGSAEEDAVQLLKLARAQCTRLGIAGSVSPERVQAWVRFGSAELHTTDALMGGVAAQEGIKLLTQQRVPVNNTLVFNGMSCTMDTFEL